MSIVLTIVLSGFLNRIRGLVCPGLRLTGRNTNGRARWDPAACNRCAAWSGAIPNLVGGAARAA